MLRRVCLIFTSVWALIGAAVVVRTFQSWWAHPVPVFNPATDGPVPDDFFDSQLGVLVLIVVMSLPLGFSWAAMTGAGFGYLRSASLTRRWLLAWGGLAGGSAAVVVAFMAAFWNPVPLFGQAFLGRPDWGLFGFLGAFLLLGLAMGAIINRSPSEGSHLYRPDGDGELAQ